MSLRAAKIEYHSSESSLMIRTANILVIKIQLLAFPSADPSLQRHNVKKFAANCACKTFYVDKCIFVQTIKLHVQILL